MVDRLKRPGGRICLDSPTQPQTRFPDESVSSRLQDIITSLSSIESTIQTLDSKISYLVEEQQEQHAVVKNLSHSIVGTPSRFVPLGGFASKESVVSALTSVRDREVGSKTSPVPILEEDARDPTADFFRRGSSTASPVKASGAISRYASRRSDRSGKSVEASWFTHCASKLPSSWPLTIPIREGLAGEDMQGSSLAEINIRTISSSAPGMSRQRRHFRFPLDPDSLFISAAQGLHMVVLLHEVMLSPVWMAWQVETKGTFFAMEVFVATVFVCDFVLNFLTAFYKDGDYICSWKEIARRYLQHWFAVDLALITIDWFSIIVKIAGGTDEAKLEASLVVLGGLRVFKLMRLGRVAVICKRMASAMLFRGNSMVHFITIPCALVIYNHLVCCLWGGIGRAADDSWLARSLPAVDDDDIATQYLASLHFTIAQMTPGPINIVAGTNLERFVNCIMLVVGLMYGSIIISQFSGHIMQITVLQRGRMQKLDEVISFLHHRQIRHALALRVRTQVNKRICQDVPQQFHQVSAFELLSHSLRQELLQEIRLPPLIASHELFRLWWGTDRTQVFPLAMHALNIMVLMPQDELFSAGQKGEYAYLLQSGTDVCYVQVPGQAHVEARQEEPIAKGSWISEAALWSHWVHVGGIDGPGNQACEFLSLLATALIKEICKARTPGRMMVLHYGRQFHLRITTACPPFSSWPTDLHVPDTDVSTLVGMKVGIGLLRVGLEQNLISLSPAMQEKLMVELQQEKCSLRSQPNGSLERLVFVVALRLHNAQDEVLVQVAKSENKKSLRVSISLPGVKRGASELQELAFQRLMEKRLPGLATGHLAIETTKSDVRRQESENFGGIPTVYQRTETLAYLGGKLPESFTLVLSDDQDVLPGVDSYYRVDDPEGSQKGYLIYAWMDQYLLGDLTSGVRPPPPGLAELIGQLDSQDHTWTEAL